MTRTTKTIFLILGLISLAMVLFSLVVMVVDSHEKRMGTFNTECRVRFGDTFHYNAGKDICVSPSGVGKYLN